jgi:hypothetical protein
LHCDYSLNDCHIYIVRGQCEYFGSYLLPLCAILLTYDMRLMAHLY